MLGPWHSLEAPVPVSLIREVQKVLVASGHQVPGEVPSGPSSEALARFPTACFPPRLFFYCQLSFPPSQTRAFEHTS